LRWGDSTLTGPNFSATEATTSTTVVRAYRELADAGVILLEARKAPRVRPGAVLAARALLREGAVFRLAGSDDPALSMLLPGARGAVVAVGPSGSYRGLGALASGGADGAALHLRHRSGEYNAPFARGILAGREPVLVHLWRREQGLIVPAGNPRQIETVGDLAHLRVARRAIGTGTRSLLDRLLREGPVAQLRQGIAQQVWAVALDLREAGVGHGGAAWCGVTKSYHCNTPLPPS